MTSGRITLARRKEKVGSGTSSAERSNLGNGNPGTTSTYEEEINQGGTQEDVSEPEQEEDDDFEEMLAGWL
eukprot:6726756-Heterocapsa_arctica.AAC.1